ncbi:UNVERIFIED_CONTAM: hypothetical protein Sradi_0900300 [Sesamum radiatum]|uniref:Uncharacterized protein n=1 Tax=Sesamum radiatum TaxID=300843 RepID=A0AAW2V1P4_SESRA
MLEEVVPFITLGKAGSGLDAEADQEMQEEEASEELIPSTLQVVHRVEGAI